MYEIQPDPSRGVSPQTNLKPIERRAIELVSYGYRFSDCARALNLTEKAVEHVIAKAKDRLGCDSLAHLTATCIRRGWL